MNPSYQTAIIPAGSERVLRELTSQQFLHPHRSAAASLEAVCHRQGYDLHLARRALEHSGICPETQAGRLTRDQIRCVAGHLELAWQSHLAKRVTDKAPAAEYTEPPRAVSVR